MHHVSSVTCMHPSLTLGCITGQCEADGIPDQTLFPKTGDVLGGAGSHFYWPANPWFDLFSCHCCAHRGRVGRWFQRGRTPCSKKLDTPSGAGLKPGLFCQLAFKQYSVYGPPGRSKPPIATFLSEVEKLGWAELPREYAADKLEKMRGWLRKPSVNPLWELTGPSLEAPLALVDPTGKSTRASPGPVVGPLLAWGLGLLCKAPRSTCMERHILVYPLVKIPWKAE